MASRSGKGIERERSIVVQPKKAVLNPWIKRNKGTACKCKIKQAFLFLSKEKRKIYPSKEGTQGS